MKQTETRKEYLIKSLNFSGVSVLTLEKEKDRVEYEAVAIQMISLDMFDKGCNMEKSCFPNAPEPCSSKIPIPDTPPCPNTPTPNPKPDPTPVPKPDPKPHDTPT